MRGRPPTPTSARPPNVEVRLLEEGVGRAREHAYQHQRRAAAGADADDDQDSVTRGDAESEW